MKIFKSSISFLLAFLFYSTISIPIITSPPLSAETKAEKTLLKFVNEVGLDYLIGKLEGFRSDCEINCYIVDEMITNAKAAKGYPNPAITAVNTVSNAALRHGSKGKAVLAEFYTYIGLSFVM